MLHLRRVPDAAICPGGHGLSKHIAFSCPMPAAGIKMVVNGATIWMTRDEAHELSQALVGVLCDG